MDSDEILLADITILMNTGFHSGEYPAILIVTNIWSIYVPYIDTTEPPVESYTTSIFPKRIKSIKDTQRIHIYLNKNNLFFEVYGQSVAGVGNNGWSHSFEKKK